MRFDCVLLFGGASRRLLIRGRQLMLECNFARHLHDFSACHLRVASRGLLSSCRSHEGAVSPILSRGFGPFVRNSEGKLIIGDFCRRLRALSMDDYI